MRAGSFLKRKPLLWPYLTIFCQESSSPSGSTPCERRASALHQKVDDIFRGDLKSKGKTRLPSYEIDGIKPRQRRQARRFPHDNDRYNDHDDCEQDDRDGQSPRRDKQSPLECSRRVIAGAGFGGGRATAGADLQTRPGVAGAVEVGDDDGEEVSAGRVAELGRRIAVRCLHVEQECFRRERAQTRLFQEQLCGARQVFSIASLLNDFLALSVVVLVVCFKPFRASLSIWNSFLFAGLAGTGTTTKPSTKSSSCFPALACSFRLRRLKTVIIFVPIQSFGVDVQVV